MSITQWRRHTFFLLLALGALFILGPILLNMVAPVHGWQIIFSSLRIAVPGFMYGG